MLCSMRRALGLAQRLCLAVAILLDSPRAAASAQAVSGGAGRQRHRSIRAGAARRDGHDHRNQHQHQPTATTNESGYYNFSEPEGRHLQGRRRARRASRRSCARTSAWTSTRRSASTSSWKSARSRSRSPSPARRRCCRPTAPTPGGMIESKMVSELPLTFNRNFQSLLVTVPGRDPAAPRALRVLQLAGLAGDRGQRPAAAWRTTRMIEGLDDNQKTGLLQVIIPAADALETVSVTTSNYDAEFGRSGGAITNVDAQVGHQQAEGQRLLLRQQREDQRQRLLHAPQGADQVRQRRVHARRPDRAATRCSSSATTSGPSTTSATSSATTVPTTAMRNGDFSAVTQRIYDPLTGDVSGSEPRRVRQQPDPRGSDQPDRAAAAGVRPAAEHRRRGARPEQLPAGADAREDDRRVRRQGQLHDEREGPDVLPRELHAAGRVRSGPVRSVRRPRQRRLRRHRHQHQLQHRRRPGRASSASRRCSTCAAA